MPVIATQPKQLSDLVKYEFADVRGYCRKQVSFKNSAEVDLEFGTVLGKRYVSQTAVATAGASNTGNGAMGAITVTNAEPGNYTLRITAAASNAGTFIVQDHAGREIGQGTVAVAFSAGGLAFTLADGATDFIVGDTFTIQVFGNEEYDILTATATDGTENAAAIYIGKPNGQMGVDYDDIAAATATNVIALVRGPAAVGKDYLILDASVNTTAEKNRVYAQLEALGFLVGDQV